MAEDPKTPVTQSQVQPQAQDVRNYLKQFLLREDFSPEELEQITAICELRDAPTGSVILREGAMNDRLHLLLSGSVGVVHAGERIACLSTPGDVLGEMSLVTGKACAASIVAESPVSLLSLELAHVAQMPESLRNRFQSATHRLYSVILAEKLKATNEKARLFEITNRELQRAQKALEAASTTKIDELSSNQHNLLRQLEGMVSSDFPSLLKLSDNPAELASGVQTLAERLKQLLAGSAAERSLQSTRVLIAEDDVQEQINARMSLGGTGAQFELVSDVEAGKQRLAEEEYDILCLNSRFLDLLDLTRVSKAEKHCVFMTSDPISDHIQTLKARPELATILARHPTDRVFTVRNMATTISKLASGDVFGLEKYLSWGTEVHQYAVTGSVQRTELIDHLQKYLAEIGIGRILNRRCTTAAEELLMNAIYDAPTDQNGKALYNHLQRTVPIQLAPEEQAIFRFACDGNLVAVSVEDAFGALTREVVLDYLERCFKGDIGVELENKGGGGNGLFQTIQSSSLVIFNVKPGSRTEVIALLSTNMQFEKTKPQPSFHFFEA